MGMLSDHSSTLSRRLLAGVGLGRFKWIKVNILPLVPVSPSSCEPWLSAEEVKSCRFCRVWTPFTLVLFTRLIVLALASSSSSVSVCCHCMVVNTHIFVFLQPRPCPLCVRLQQVHLLPVSEPPQVGAAAQYKGTTPQGRFQQVDM